VTANSPGTSVHLSGQGTPRRESNRRQSHPQTTARTARPLLQSRPSSQRRPAPAASPSSTPAAPGGSTIHFRAAWPPFSTLGDGWASSRAACYSPRRLQQPPRQCTASLTLTAPPAAALPYTASLETQNVAAVTKFPTSDRPALTTSGAAARVGLHTSATRLPGSPTPLSEQQHRRGRDDQVRFAALPHGGHHPRRAEGLHRP
jgi:hypothetical protein